METLGKIIKLFVICITLWAIGILAAGYFQDRKPEAGQEIIQNNRTAIERLSDLAGQDMPIGTVFIYIVLIVSGAYAVCRIFGRPEEHGDGRVLIVNPENVYVEKEAARIEYTEEAPEGYLPDCEWR
ncbi:MAG: hypothetical protein GY765_19185 [bacterium]|nr:hypothetical protein [bacterium]